VETWESVRTAINLATGSNPRRKAADGLLYSQRRVVVKGAKEHCGLFAGGLVLPGIPELPQLAAEIDEVVRVVLRGVGKGHSRITAELEAATLPAAVSAGRVKLVLETPALVLDPAKVYEYRNRDLRALYQGWLESMCPGATLIDFWCRQELRGGFIGRRFPSNGAEYEPFLLESAGSCWLLDVTSTGAAELNDWQEKGMRIPEWAKEKYQDKVSPLWERCPFIPENGFGEVRLEQIKSGSN